MLEPSRAGALGRNHFLALLLLESLVCLGGLWKNEGRSLGGGGGGAGGGCGGALGRG